MTLGCRSISTIENVLGKVRGVTRNGNIERAAVDDMNISIQGAESGVSTDVKTSGYEDAEIGVNQEFGAPP